MHPRIPHNAPTMHPQCPHGVCAPAPTLEAIDGVSPARAKDVKVPRPAADGSVAKVKAGGPPADRCLARYYGRAMLSGYQVCHSHLCISARANTHEPCNTLVLRIPQG